MHKNSPPVSSTVAASQKSSRATLMAIAGSTSLQALVSGNLPPAVPVGPTPYHSGRGPVRASRSRPSGKRKARKTRDTSGLKCPASSGLDGPLWWLASRLQARTDYDGSPEYALTWKRVATSPTQWVLTLRCSARPTRDTDFIGWATPAARDWKDSAGMSRVASNPDGSIRTRCDQLPRQVSLRRGWMEAVEPPDFLGIPRLPPLGKPVMNPDFPRWLMGIPRTWSLVAPDAASFRRTATPSSPNSPNSSSPNS